MLALDYIPVQTPFRIDQFLLGVPHLPGRRCKVWHTLALPGPGVPHRPDGDIRCGTPQHYRGRVCHTFQTAIKVWRTSASSVVRYATLSGCNVEFRCVAWPLLFLFATRMLQDNFLLFSKIFPDGRQCALSSFH